MLAEVGILVLEYAAVGAFKATMNRRQRLGLRWRCRGNARKQGRVSFGALLKVEHQQEFALVENNRRPGLLTPIGGVYRAFPSARALLDGFEFHTDGTEGSMGTDLRGTLPQGQQYPCVRWFEDSKEREAAADCTRRELAEEAPEVAGQFGTSIASLAFRPVRRVIEGPLIVGEHPDTASRQVRLLDVVEPRTDAGVGKALIEALRTHAQAPDSPVVFATIDEIKKGRMQSDGRLIGQNAAYLFSSRRYQAEPTPP